MKHSIEMKRGVDVKSLLYHRPNHPSEDRRLSPQVRETVHPFASEISLSPFSSLSSYLYPENVLVGVLPARSRLCVLRRHREGRDHLRNGLEHRNWRRCLE